MTKNKGPTKHPGGRPTKYKEEYIQLVYNYALLGATDDEIGFFFGVSEATVNDWKSKIPEFGSSIKKGREDAPEHKRNKELKKEKRREYKKQAHIKGYANNYVKNKLKTDPKYRVRFNVASVMRSRLKSKNKTGVFRNLGYTSKDLCVHLESLFVGGMTWDNYGSKWHIDHIKPDKLFNYISEDDEDFKLCWSLNNLQPLWAFDNLSKGSKIIS